MTQDGRNVSRLKFSLRPSATRHRPTSPEQEFKFRNDDLEEGSSSTASFETCPETESIDAFQPKDNVVDDVVLAEDQAISGTLPSTTETQLGEKQNSDNELCPSTFEVEDLCRGRDKRTSWIQRWFDAILRRKPQTPSESSTSNEGSRQPGYSMALVPSKLQPETTQDGLSPGTGLRVSSNLRTMSAKIISLKTTNELGYKNLAELYARYGEVEKPRQESGLENLKISAETRSSAVLARNQASDDMDEMQCRSCRLYFTPDQNLRDLDNGQSPCSFHPGKMHSRHTQAMETCGSNNLIGEPRQGGASTPTATDSRYAWTCCHRLIPRDEFFAGPKKTPGCVSAYHYDIEKSLCHVCHRLFTHRGDCFHHEARACR